MTYTYLDRGWLPGLPARDLDLTRDDIDPDLLAQAVALGLYEEAA